nr:uncharacterized mitochondrial protein AtMg00810-like [Tanacetum cinerariifolium]
MPALEDVSIFNFSNDDGDDDIMADMNNMDTTIQMDVKSAFLYEKIKEEVYVCQPPRFLKIQTFLIEYTRLKKHCMNYIKLQEHGLQVKQKNDGIFISQDKYVVEILKKFRFTEVKNASTSMEIQKSLLKDEDGEELDVHMYRSMIGSLMYLTSLRPDIMFAVYACARYQVNLKVSHLHAMKRIFRYLKSQPKPGLWYLKDSPFDLVAYTNSDCARESLDKKSTIGGCQFLGCRLISWQCKKQTVVANSTTKAKYIAASSCCGQVLWIRNQLLDYGDKLFEMKLELILLVLGITYYWWVNVNVVEFWSTAITKTINGEAQLHAKVDGKKIIVTESSVRRDIRLADEEVIDCLPNSTIFEILALMGPKTTAWNEFNSTMASAIICLASNQKSNFSKLIFDSMIRNLDDVSDEAIHKELDDSLVRAATTASSLEAEQDSSNITKTQSKATPNESSSYRTNSGGGPGCQETIGDTIAQTRVLDLEKTKTTQQNETDSLKRRVKKLEKRNRSRTHKLKKLYKVGLTARVESSGDEESLGEDAPKQERRIDAIDVDEEITHLAERLQAQEQEELSDAEKAKLFQQLLKKRRKHFTAKRAEEKRNKPPTQA